MPIDPVSGVVGALAAFKTAADSVRSAISLVKEVLPLGGGTEEQKKAIDTALTVASSNTAIAEAQAAQAFGYELCKCEYPPTPMLTVGYFERHPQKDREGGPVYECPKCGYNTAGPFNYKRLETR